MAGADRLGPRLIAGEIGGARDDRRRCARRFSGCGARLHPAPHPDGLRYCSLITPRYVPVLAPVDGDDRPMPWRYPEAPT